MEILVNQYMILLSTEEQQFLKLYLENPQVTNKTLLSNKPFVLLREKPYPVLDILLLQPSHKYVHIEQTIIKTFEDFVKDVASTGATANFLKFLIKIPDDILNNALQGKVREDFQQCLNNSLLNDQFYLPLLARKEKQLLHDILEYLKETKWQYFHKPLASKEFVLHQALKSKSHFVNALLKENDNFNDVDDVALRNNLIILKLVYELSKLDQKIDQMLQIGTQLDALDLESIEEESKPIYLYFYKDFKRISTLISYIRKYPDVCSSMSIEEVISTSSPLEIINKHKLFNTYDEAKTLIESYYAWQSNALLLAVKDKELEILCYFAILSTICDIVTINSEITREEMYTEKLNALNSLLRQVKNINLLSDILDDILKCICIKWEHFNNDCNTMHKRLRSSSSSSYTDNDNVQDSIAKTRNNRTKVKKTSAKLSRTGFICNSKAFSLIANFLKQFVTKKLHSVDYKQSASETKEKFQNIVDNIGGLLWKFEFLKKIDQSRKQMQNQNIQIYVEPDCLVTFVHFHANQMQADSSDEEDKIKSRQHTRQSRRKAANRRRNAPFTGRSISAGDANLPKQQSPEPSKLLANSESSEEPFTRLSESKVETLSHLEKEERSIIPSLLSSPERLAVLALSLKQFSEAKQIIENFGLHDSELDLELQFMEQQQQVKQRLSAIYENYQQQERQTSLANEPLATVEQIRNVAAKGFEESKIISVIDHFALVQRIRQAESIKELLHKHKSNPQYPFLSHFEEANLNAVLICDIILSLPLNRDIATSVVMVIKRHQAIQSSFGEKKRTEMSQLPTNIGPLNFLENMVDCMRILGDKSIKQMLCDNIYSLNPQKLSEELEKEQIFRNVFYKSSGDVNTCDDLKALVPQFQALKSNYNYYQRFCSYMHHLSKLVHLRDTNRRYHIEQLMKFDPLVVIGDLLFSCDMTPLEIEPIVNSLNLNLVHVISLNICPEIMAQNTIKKRFLTKKNESTVLNYISNHNRLLVYLLKGILDVSTISQDEYGEHINPLFMERLVHLPEIEKLSSLYDGNKVIAALKSDHVSMKLLEQLDSKMNQLELLQLEIGIQEPKPLKSKRLDSLIVDLIQENAKNIHLVSKISDIGVRATLIHENFTKITTPRLAKELIEATLKHRQAVEKIPPELRQNLEKILADITIYAKVSEVMQFETWPQAYDFSLKTPTTIFRRLLQLRLYKICYEWCRVVKLSENVQLLRKEILNILLEVLVDFGDEEETSPNFECEYLLQILNTFHPDECKEFLEINKDKFRSLALVRYSIEYLERFANAEQKENLRNYKISILIFEHLTPRIRKLFWKLIKFPFLIVEQLLMNAKFEILTKILTLVRQELQKVTSRSGVSIKKCIYCFDKNGYIYDIHTKTPTSPRKVCFKLGEHDASSSSAFMLLNFNLYQQNHIITNDCIDLLLRIYATKALDYQISDTNSSSDPCSQSTSDTQRSMDSLCGDFKIPSHAPARSNWVRDEDATHCMCCRRAAFTMFMRRHHCRRCGRVVCFACSAYRMKIPEIYEDVEVRICNDCHSMCENISQQRANSESLSAETEYAENNPIHARPKADESLKWKLTGNITHDKLLREEFCYEHAPSVALCLSILDYHLDKQKCVDLLLFHCKQLEKLIIPNPEVDFELVAKMMNCLALAAKVRGAPVETIRDHSEIIISVVQNGCESLIQPPPNTFKKLGLIKLGDALAQAEKWDLALEVHMKNLYSTAGVMAAHGLSCLKAGCYDTAREKFNNCMVKLTNDTINAAIKKIIFNPVHGPGTSDNADISILGLESEHEFTAIKRPQNGPPLLQEILKLLESEPINPPEQETLRRASIIRSSNNSLATLLSRSKEPYVKRMHEPAVNILNTLANLKRISKGQYTLNSSSSAGNTSDRGMQRKQLFRKSRGFEESVYYVLTYGSHFDVIQFLMNHKDYVATLKYYLLQKLDADIFVHYIYLVLLKMGCASQLIKLMHEFDNQLLIWRPTLLHTCRYLETQNLLNSLYELQVLLKDPVRAAMTCVKFYTMNCDSFQQQHINAHHLNIAQQHLQLELENAQWETLNLNIKSTTKSKLNTNRRSSTISSTSNNTGSNFQLQMDGRSLNAHVTTISYQLEAAKFLATCEVENSKPNELITQIFLKQIRSESQKALPTLFDKTPEKIQICILILLCGKNIEEGFGLAYRIIQHYKLSPINVYAASAKYLVENNRLCEIEKLINSITSNNGISSSEIDEVISVAINSAKKPYKIEERKILDNLVKKIQAIELTISCHISIGQLKSAYLLANKYERLRDIRRILREAESTNQVHIKKLCEKKLQISLTSSAKST